MQRIFCCVGEKVRCLCLDMLAMKFFAALAFLLAQGIRELLPSFAPTIGTLDGLARPPSD